MPIEMDTLTRRFITPIKRKIFLLIGRAILTAVDNSTKTQSIQVTVMKNEVITDVERPQNYGLESYPKSDTEAIIVFQNGDRDKGLVLCVHDRENRPTTLTQGEVCVWSDSGNKITMKVDGTIHLEGNGGALEFAPLVSKLVSKINSEVITKFNSHTHTGVTIGAAVSGPPAAPMTVTVPADFESSKVKVS